MANNISTLKSDIAEMEEVFNDASTPSDIKKALEPALKKAKEDLAELEKKETVEKPAVTKKEVTTKKSPSDALKKCQDLLAKYQNKKENDAERVKKRASQGKPPTLTPAETVKSTAKKVEAKVVDMMERTGEGLQSSEINQLASGIIATIKSTLEGIEDTTKKQRFLKEIGKEIHDLEKRLPKAAAMGMYMAKGGEMEKGDSIDDRYMIYGTTDEGWFAVDKKTKQQISPSIFGKGSWDSEEEVLRDLNSKKFEDGGSIADSNTEMLMSNVHSIKHHAEEIENILANKVPIEAWVSAKAERASTDLSDITHYLDGLVGKMAIGGMLEHDLHRGDEVKEIYKDYGILEDADMNIFVYDPNVGERVMVGSMNEAKRMIDSMDSDLRKRAGLMEDGGKMEVKNPDAQMKAASIQEAVKIATFAVNNGIKASDLTFEEFSNKIFDLTNTSFVKSYLKLAYESLKSSGYADGGEIKTGDFVNINGRKTKVLDTYTDKSFGAKNIYLVNVPIYEGVKNSQMTKSRYIKDDETGELRKIERKDFVMADGGHTQGYDDREDERLSMEYGKISGKDFVGSHKQREHSRRDDARFEERMAKGGKLIGKQKNIDVNKNGKLDSQDFKLLRERAKARLKK